ncbi:enoyl-ACP reductase [Polynucleobacter aenigmaticus]|uniref:Enoyl-[acyl-carrier-protein] reductase [NADH] n=1 Tax=Polynucleobacter aenigmaticus TaxID=1743164 RepID=A0A254PZ92_9BURK|nr:enoyl-ACP reductase [Polynucleobacter aenigmaticus]
MKMLKGKKGIVFGVANDKSIAYAVAKKLGEEGASVMASCLNQKAYDIVSPGLLVLDIPVQSCNVEDLEQLKTFIDDAATRFGKFDFIVHSIAWAPLEDLHGKVIDSSSAGFSRAMAVSCHSFAEIAHLCLPYMKDGGSMVTMTYIGADEAVPHYGLMGPVKAALESLVRYMALELGPQKIRVHAVSPGPILTRAASGIEEFDALMKHAIERAPLGRLVTTEEVANLTAFLCDDGSSGMTGQTIYVDGGCHAVA